MGYHSHSPISQYTTTMNDSPPSSKFLLGNALLAIAMVILLAMGQIWQWLGAGTMVLWVILVALGVYLILSDRSGPPSFPE